MKHSFKTIEKYCPSANYFGHALLNSCFTSSPCFPERSIVLLPHNGYNKALIEMFITDYDLGAFMMW